MKKLLETFVFTFALLLGVCSLTLAQESTTHQYANGTSEGQNDGEYEVNQDNEGTPTKPHPSKPDSISVKPSLKTKQPVESQKPVIKADEDAFSFNFLYYVIQRFKSSDIIED